jgi:hypothetical protein
VNENSALLPTFSEFRDILIRDFGCLIAPPMRNLIYGPSHVTVLSRIVEGSEFEWVVCLGDRERITGEIALNACRCLQISPEQVELPDPEPAS